MCKWIVALAAIAAVSTATIPITPADAQFNRGGFNNNFNNNRAAFNNRFARSRFASCSIVRRTWTPVGWRMRRVWIC
jgi:hypothetical protein